jgi:type II secretory pathway component PulJ
MRTAPHTHDGQQGATLVELLVYIALSSIVATGLYSVLISNMNAYDSIETRLTMAQDMRAATSLLNREIRMAGCDPIETGNMGFENNGDDRYNTDANSMHFTRDMDSDSRSTSIGEEIIYYRNSLNQLIRRADYQGLGVMEDVPIMENVSNLAFTYFQADGVTPAASLAAIRIVQAAITAQAEKKDRTSGNTLTKSQTLRVMVRNAGIQ